MPNGEQLLPPPIQWAQRKHLIFLTVCLEDCKNPTIKIEPDRLYFRGSGGPDKKGHEVTVEFFNEIIPEDSRHIVRDRMVEFMFKKREEGPYWKRLTKDDKKYHWLKVDFNKWRDEDDSDEEQDGNQDLEEMFRQMGGLGGGGDKPDLDDLDAGDEADDSDDEDLPDLE